MMVTMSSIFSRDEINRFLLNGSDDTFLMIKCVMKIPHFFATDEVDISLSYASLTEEKFQAKFEENSSPNKDEGYANGSSHSTVDGAFRNVQKNTAAFLIWRIENMNVISVPKDQYGTFHTNDSYIIYAASQYGVPSGTDAVSREIRSGSLEYHIHFWLGSATTPDKSGVSAYKTVELDGHLGGIATQHRETQGNESARFKSYFKNGFRILKGGTDSGFKSAVKLFENRLYKVKGRRTPIITQEESVSWNFFNSGDVFLILTPKILFVWIGRAANGIEKLHAAKAALMLKTENDIPNITFVDDGYEKTLHEEDKLEFNKYLPLEKRAVYPPDHAGDDTEKEKQSRTNIRLYRCSDNSGKYRVAEVKTGPIIQTDLNCEDVYILDNGLNGIWVWVGKKASEKERTEALRNARGFVKKKNYPNNTRVTRVVDGGEPMEFRMLFLSWKEKDEVKGLGKTHTATKVGKVAVAKFDATTMYERPALAAESQLVDDGSGDLKIWKITKTTAVEVLKNRHGTFFAGDCYLVLYTYKAPSQKNIIYYWLGSQATPEEVTLTSLKVVEMNQEIGGTAVQVRVIQGHEPPHFLQLFKGNMIIFRGKASEYEAEYGRNSKGPSHYLLQIFGSSTYTAKALHVHCKASSLNSNYCYVLKKHKHCYIWCGSYSTGDQREMAKGFVGKDFDILMEGKETSEFWEDLGGQMTYATMKNMDENGDHRVVRLFQCSTASGNFKVEEIMNFSQSDLIPEDVMLLDAHNTIFIWIGNLSTKQERKLAIETARSYLKTDPAGRNVNTPITEIRQGHEPPNFTGFFTAWSNSFWAVHKPFEEFRNEIEGINVTINTKDRIGYGEDNNFDQYVKYPINILTAASDKLPSKVDPLQKELHLTHDDFVSLFNMNYSEFETLPKWKQQEMKKKVGLF